MKTESSYIFIKDARFHAFHGVLPQEKTLGQDFLVSVRCGVDISYAMEHDSLEGTLDYGALYRLVRQQMDIPSRLVEHVAGRIAHAVFENFPQTKTLDLSITKQNPPIGADCNGAGVELHLTR